MIKKILLSSLIFCQVSFAGLFDNATIKTIENFLIYAPIPTPVIGGCISYYYKAYEPELARRSVSRFQELEEAHQNKVNAVAQKISSYSAKDSEENLKNMNILVALKQQQALADKQKAFLIEQNTRLQGIVVDIRAIE